MSAAIHKHAAHCVVAGRSIMILVAVWLFSTPALRQRIAALILLVIALALDGVDGFLARRYRTSSDTGALLDTLADRITENVMMVLFAAERMIPLGIAVFVITRSLIADFIRTLNFQKGIGTFAIHTSFWGRIFVASPVSRALYLGVKCALFVLGGLVFVLQASDLQARDRLLLLSGRGLYYLAYLVLLCSAVRFGFLLYDSRNTIRDRLARR
jgi:phosphatidylglycerophosphate synthase